MRGQEEGHVENKLQALLDGELGDVESEAVRGHLAQCKSCSKTLEESKAVLSALSAESEASPVRPMWPAVKAVISPAPRRLGFSFGLATSLAAAAGLVIGLSIGSPGEAPVESPETDSEYTDAILGTDDILSLDQMYVSAFEEDGESK
jgi:anti-sigma factor RsiW